MIYTRTGNELKPFRGKPGVWRKANIVIPLDAMEDEPSPRPTNWRGPWPPVAKPDPVDDPVFLDGEIDPELPAWLAGTARHPNADCFLVGIVSKAGGILRRMVFVGTLGETVYVAMPREFGHSGSLHAIDRERISKL